MEEGEIKHCLSLAFYPANANLLSVFKSLSKACYLTLFSLLDMDICFCHPSSTTYSDAADPIRGRQQSRMDDEWTKECRPAQSRPETEPPQQGRAALARPGELDSVYRDQSPNTQDLFETQEHAERKADGSALLHTRITQTTMSSQGTEMSNRTIQTQTQTPRVLVLLSASELTGKCFRETLHSVSGFSL